PYAPGWGPAKDQLPEVDEGPLDLTLHFCDVLDALDIARAHVVGVSIGAWMAAELAAIEPTRVARLVLVNPLGLWLDGVGGEDPFAQHPGFPSQVLFAAPDGRKQHLLEGRDKVDAHVEELLNLRASAKFLWPIPDTGVKRRLPRIKAATLVVTSEADAVVPAAYGPAWRDAIGGARLTTLAGAGHLAGLEQPQAFARTVADFLGDAAIAAVA
ncbi:MAG: alpha/beta fold hydrolase, partial [Gammaproteobacteria bacterium]